MINDEYLSHLAGGGRPKDGDYDEVLTPMSRELLAKRIVERAARRLLTVAEPCTCAYRETQCPVCEMEAALKEAPK